MPVIVYKICLLLARCVIGFRRHRKTLVYLFNFEAVLHR